MRINLFVSHVLIVIMFSLLITNTTQVTAQNNEYWVGKWKVERILANFFQPTQFYMLHKISVDGMNVCILSESDIQDVDQVLNTWTKMRFEDPQSTTLLLFADPTMTKETIPYIIFPRQEGVRYVYFFSEGRWWRVCEQHDR